MSALLLTHIQAYKKWQYLSRTKYMKMDYLNSLLLYKSNNNFRRFDKENLSTTGDMSEKCVNFLSILRSRIFTNCLINSRVQAGLKGVDFTLKSVLPVWGNYSLQCAKIHSIFCV